MVHVNQIYTLVSTKLGMKKLIKLFVKNRSVKVLKYAATYLHLNADLNISTRDVIGIAMWIRFFTCTIVSDIDLLTQ